MTEKYEKVTDMTVGDIAQSMSEGEVFYRNETPIEIDSARCGIFLSGGKAAMDLGSLRMELNDGLIYRKIKTPWWERHVDGLVMVRDDDERWHPAHFKEYIEGGIYPFGANDSRWKQMRPLTQAERDTIITEG